jgi:hypothetical protein
MITHDNAWGRDEMTAVTNDINKMTDNHNKMTTTAK